MKITTYGKKKKEYVEDSYTDCNNIFNKIKNKFYNESPSISDLSPETVLSIIYDEEFIQQKTKDINKTILNTTKNQSHYDSETKPRRLSLLNDPKGIENLANYTSPDGDLKLQKNKYKICAFQNLNTNTKITTLQHSFLIDESETKCDLVQIKTNSKEGINQIQNIFDKKVMIKIENEQKKENNLKNPKLLCSNSNEETSSNVKNEAKKKDSVINPKATASSPNKQTISNNQINFKKLRDGATFQAPAVSSDINKSIHAQKKRGRIEMKVTSTDSDKVLSFTPKIVQKKRVNRAKATDPIKAALSTPKLDMRKRENKLLKLTTQDFNKSASSTLKLDMRKRENKAKATDSSRFAISTPKYDIRKRENKNIQLSTPEFNKSATSTPKLDMRKRENRLLQHTTPDFTKLASSTPDLDMRKRENRLLQLTTPDFNKSASSILKIGLRESVIKPQAAAQDFNKSTSPTHKLDMKKRKNNLLQLTTTDFNKSASSILKIGLSKRVINPQVAAQDSNKDPISRSELKIKKNVKKLADTTQDSNKDPFSSSELEMRKRVNKPQITTQDTNKDPFSSSEPKMRKRVNIPQVIKSDFNKGLLSSNDSKIKKHVKKLEVTTQDSNIDLSSNTELKTRKCKRKAQTQLGKENKGSLYTTNEGSDESNLKSSISSTPQKKRKNSFKKSFVSCDSLEEVEFMEELDSTILEKTDFYSLKRKKGVNGSVVLSNLKEDIIKLLHKPIKDEGEMVLDEQFSKKTTANTTTNDLQILNQKGFVDKEKSKKNKKLIKKKETDNHKSNTTLDVHLIQKRYNKEITTEDNHKSYIKNKGKNNEIVFDLDVVKNECRSDPLTDKNFKNCNLSNRVGSNMINRNDDLQYSKNNGVSSGLRLKNNAINNIHKFSKSKTKTSKKSSLALNSIDSSSVNELKENADNKYFEFTKPLLEVDVKRTYDLSFMNITDIDDFENSIEKNKLKKYYAKKSGRKLRKMRDIKTLRSIPMTLINRKKEQEDSLYLKNIINLKTVEFDSLYKKNVVKINEATFSDVFYLSDFDLIVKIVNIEKSMSEEEFIKECCFNKILGKEYGVVKSIDMFFALGVYPPVYRKAWNLYHKNYPLKAENNEPEHTQKLYGIIVMNNAGVSLEDFVFEKGEIELFFEEIIQILYNLEIKYKFEHRDLHWGNILIKRINNESERTKSYDNKHKKSGIKKTENVNKIIINANVNAHNGLINQVKGFKRGHNSKLQISIIDFSLSRLEYKGKIIYTNLNQKEWIFQGDENYDIQFGVYKKMKRNNWQTYDKKSNFYWFSYIVSKIESKVGINKVTTKFKNYVMKYQTIEQMYMSHFKKETRKCF